MPAGVRASMLGSAYDASTSVCGAPPRRAGKVDYSVVMCIICIDLAKQAMSPSEARRALREMREALDKNHLAEVETKVREAEADHDAPTRP
jgi:hypothetical protein